MNSSLLRKVYKMYGIKKKRYRWFKVARGQTPAMASQELARVKRQLTMARNAGYRIVYLDETMFTRKTLADTEWSLPG